MKEEYKDKTKKQLINELVELRQRIAELEASENERKRVEEELRGSQEHSRFLADVLERSSQPFAVGYPDGRLKTYNTAYCKLLGYSKEEMHQLKWFTNLTPPEWREVVAKAAEEIRRSEQPQRFEKEYIRKDGSRVPVEVFAHPIFDSKGNLQYFYSIFTDITERKRAEEGRKRLLKELEAKNTELERFTYTVSHDLRSPLVTIQGFAEVLRKDLEQNEIEKVKSNLKYIESSATKMDRLLTDTLQLSRIGRMGNPPEDVPFGEIVQEARVQTTVQIKSSGVEVSVAEDFHTVHVDQMRIVEVLVNLITNSINYMGEQSYPKIDIGYRTDDGETVFFVRDNGIGIDESQHEKVFELFYTVDKSGKGTGAGLAIVKRIIEVHNGRIWIESEKGKGCTVCFTLPGA